jgi:hypothetical protein
MNDGLNPSGRPSLRLYRAEQSEQDGRRTDAQRVSQQVSQDTDQLKYPQILTHEQISAELLRPINFSDRVTRAVAPPQANIHDVVDALNARWRTLTGSAHLLGPDALKALLMVSPVHLQKASGQHLVFEAALSEGRTENRVFAEQRRELRVDTLGVASPASTAIAMAALLVKAIEHGKGIFIDHLTLKSFRTQAVDPVNGHSLDHHMVVVKYDFTDGIVARHEPLRNRSSNLWCAGSAETFESRPRRSNLFGWLFGS